MAMGSRYTSTRKRAVDYFSVFFEEVTGLSLGYLFYIGTRIYFACRVGWVDGRSMSSYCERRSDDTQFKLSVEVPPISSFVSSRQTLSTTCVWFCSGQAALWMPNIIIIYDCIFLILENYSAFLPHFYRASEKCDIKQNNGRHCRLDSAREWGMWDGRQRSSLWYRSCDIMMINIICYIINIIYDVGIYHNIRYVIPNRNTDCESQLQSVCNCIVFCMPFIEICLFMRINDRYRVGKYHIHSFIQQYERRTSKHFWPVLCGHVCVGHGTYPCPVRHPRACGDGHASSHNTASALWYDIPPKSRPSSKSGWQQFAKLIIIYHLCNVGIDIRAKGTDIRHSNRLSDIHSLRCWQQALSEHWRGPALGRWWLWLCNGDYKYIDDQFRVVGQLLHQIWCRFFKREYHRSVVSLNDVDDDGWWILFMSRGEKLWSSWLEFPFCVERSRLNDSFFL